LKGHYLKYSDDFYSPRGREAIDYRYVWNTEDTLEEMAEIALGAAPLPFLKMDAGYGVLNRKYRRRFFTLQPFFFVLGYEELDTLDRFYAGFNKKYKAFDAHARYDKYGAIQILNYAAQYAFNTNITLGWTGAYDHDTATSGISNTLNLTTPVLLLSAGHRSISDTTFLFGSATVNYLYRGLSLNGDLQQSQRYSQKRDEAYLKVDDGKGNYVYDPNTGTYIKKDGGDYIRKVYLLPDFTRVIARNFGIDIGYTSSFYDMSGRFYYVDEEDLQSHREDIIFNLLLPAYEVTLNLGQNFQDDARYALARNTAMERTASLVSLIGALTGRVEYRLMSDKIGEQERERRTTYQGEISYDVLERPIVRPKAGYGNSRIHSGYFAELDIRQHAPKLGLLFSLPLRAIKGKVETSVELVYRMYNIEDIPFFFAATEPDGLTTTLQAFAGFGVGANTVFNLIYRIEFRPDDEINQNLRLQSRIRF
jgi:hypothetical protein